MNINIYLLSSLFVILSLLNPCFVSGIDTVVHSEKSAQIESKSFYSEVFELNEPYMSMEGPEQHQNVRLTDDTKPELLWVVAAKATILKKDQTTPLPPEYFCHTLFLAKFAPFRITKPRHLYKNILDASELSLFSLAQGHMEIRFPDHFGIPIISNEEFVYASMPMNPPEKMTSIDLIIKKDIEFIRNRNVKEIIKPLFPRAIIVEVPVDMHEHHQHKGSHPNQLGNKIDNNEIPNPVQASLKFSSVSENGKTKSFHWLVPPGRHVYRYNLTGDSFLPFDTTVHYIFMHMHRFGESMELRDLTLNKTIFKSYTKHLANGIGIEEMNHYSSSEGIPLFRNHHYEVISIYNNETEGEIDAMATFGIYLHNKNFKKSDILNVTNPPK